MSTNFYMYDGVGVHKIHLGQRAGGWKFLFKADRDRGVTDIHSWLRQLDNATRIIDEYGFQYNEEEFLQEVEFCEYNRARQLYGPDYWFDKDGNCFCAKEFH